MKRNDYLILGGSVLAVLAAYWVVKSKVGYGKTVPEVGESNETAYDMFEEIFPYQWGEHFVVDSGMDGPVVLPVRYPPRPGHELTCMIEGGFTPMFRPQAGLASWVDSPPSEG